MIIYTKRCLSCTDRLLWKKIRAFAAAHGLAIEERRVGKDPAWKDEADRYGVEMPFVVHGKVALSLTEDLEKLL